jgi:hypothetical protein
MTFSIIAGHPANMVCGDVTEETTMTYFVDTRAER